MNGERTMRPTIARARPGRALRVLASCVVAAMLALPLASLRDAHGAHRASAEPPAAAASAGAAIFQRGVLVSGEPLEATHDGGVRLRGAAAACMNCHRRSGLGSREGTSSIPPITGRYLFHPRVEGPDDLDIPFVPGMRTSREPYTDATIARAIREGLDSEGKPLGNLMPQYALNDVDMRALIDYLKRLDRHGPTGVEDTVLHFATIITPDADLVKKRGMLDVLEHYFDDKNVFPLGATPPLRSSRKMMFMVNRRWQLHVWELSGPPATWHEQLKRDLAAQPVLAVVSGLGGRNWAPVHAFCEEEAVPCLFPNVEVPVENDRDFYSVYFTKGVLLEAELIAKRIVDESGGKPVKAVRVTTAAKAAPTVWQIYREGDNGEPAAHALAAVLGGHGIAVSNLALAPGESVSRALHRASDADVLVLWLRPADIAALGGAPPRAAAVFMSGLMGGLDHAPLPQSWRGVTRLAYPFDLPEGRRVRVDYAFGWFSIRHIPIVADQVQADTYLACGLLAEMLKHTVDAFIRDYLIERMEDMLERRILTGYYPRLTLAPGQRFASKGGYIVRFAEPDHVRLVADGAWMVP